MGSVSGVHGVGQWCACQHVHADGEPGCGWGLPDIGQLAAVCGRPGSIRAAVSCCASQSLRYHTGSTVALAGCSGSTCSTVSWGFLSPPPQVLSLILGLYQQASGPSRAAEVQQGKSYVSALCDKCMAVQFLTKQTTMQSPHAPCRCCSSSLFSCRPAVVLQHRVA